MKQINVYNMKSITAERFAEAGELILGGKSGTRRISRLDPDKPVFNWGTHSDLDANLVFNKAEAIKLWSHKGRVCDTLSLPFSPFKGLFIPMTKDKAVAQAWLDGGTAVVVRTLMNASNGRGILMVDPAGEGEPPVELPDAPLYTKYMKKRNEYRVHVGVVNDVGTIIAAQRKARRRNADYHDQRIRNAHDTGAGSWVFLHQEISELPQEVIDTAIDFIEGSHGTVPLLDYAGIDIGYNEHHDNAFIIETNTAPGLGENDVQAYIQFFQRLLGE